MKSLYYLSIFTLLLSLNGAFCLGQDAPAGLPKPETAAGEEPQPKGSALAGQEFRRASQNFDDVFHERLQNVIRRVPGPVARPLVIRSSSMDAKDQANLEEDLAVMARVLEKVVEEPADPSHTYTAMGISVFGAVSPAPLQNFYLDGYGAVFMLRVGYPLLPGLDKPEAKNEGTEPDSAWAQARQELYGQGPAGGSFGPAGVPFSEDKVNDLKTRLFDALKSSGNIRELKPEDSIMVCIFGRTSGGVMRFGGGPRSQAANALAGSGGGAAYYVTDRGGQRGTVMTVRVKKADVDAWVKGKLDGEQFRRHARVETYAGGASGGDSGVFGTAGGGGVGAVGGY